MPTSSIVTSWLAPPPADCSAAGAGAADCCCSGAAVLWLSAFFSPPPQAANANARPAANEVTRIVALASGKLELCCRPCEPFHKTPNIGLVAHEWKRQFMPCDDR